MYEYSIPEDSHIAIPSPPEDLFFKTISLLGDISEVICKPIINIDEFEILQKELKLTAFFFDSYVGSKLNESISNEVLLLGSAAYYLTNMPGSSVVMVSQIKDYDKQSDLTELLKWLLRGKYKITPLFEGPYKDLIGLVSKRIMHFYNSGNQTIKITAIFEELKKHVYLNSNEADVLYFDLCYSITKIKIQNSSWSILPKSSGVSQGEWSDTLRKDSFIKELWPAQRKLAVSGVFSGASAIVQMPTSAGKTRSVEIIARSAFLRNATKLVVIIAPFRSLCHEISQSYQSAFKNEDVIINELTDVFQKDAELNSILDDTKNQIVIVTPEKCLYLMRQSSEFVKKVHLLILDEGHQFDTGIRGVTYELLVAQLKILLPSNVQKVVISAVISNAAIISKWINGIDGQVIDGKDLNSTFRSVGFVSWKHTAGWLQFVNPNDPDEDEFFVPRVIQTEQLNRLKGESKTKFKYFPQKDDGSSVALFLGLRLICNGGVAVFCGRKDSATSMSERYLDLIKRDTNIPSPKQYSDQAEITKLSFLLGKNLGDNSVEALCALHGVFFHHASIPNGLKMCIEHAMREDLIRFVLCTSTLAQGVNLPIRYLIFTSIYQAGEKIKVRDFHNLIGRAGRSGMQTEGSILFADYDVYDNKNNFKEKWRWKEVKSLLDLNMAEPCLSSILQIFDQVENNRQATSKMVLNLDIMSFISSYLNSSEHLIDIIEQVANLHENKGFDRKTLLYQLDYKIKILGAIESYLISAIQEIPKESRPDAIVELAKQTFAYSLSDEATKLNLERIFVLIGEKIASTVEDEKIKSFSKAILGATQLIEIENWIDEKFSEILEATTIGEEETLKCLWPLINRYIENNDFKRCEPETVKLDIALEWMEGVTFAQILNNATLAGAHIKTAKQQRVLKVHTIVDICEGGLSYNGMLVISAALEILSRRQYVEDTLVPQVLLKLIKNIKYGLSDPRSIRLYEAGFTDRVLAQELAPFIKRSKTRKDLVLSLIEAGDKIKHLLKSYPSYYMTIFQRLVDYKNSI